MCDESNIELPDFNKMTTRDIIRGIYVEVLFLKRGQSGFKKQFSNHLNHHWKAMVIVATSLMAGVVSLTVACILWYIRLGS